MGNAKEIYIKLTNLYQTDLLTLHINIQLPNKDQTQFNTPNVYTVLSDKYFK